MLSPEETTQLPKENAEKLIQQYTDTYNTKEYSRRTANSILTVIKALYKANGYKNNNELDIERYYVPTRYRKTEEYIPQKHEIYKMTDAATSLRNKAIILSLYSGGFSNSTLRTITYKDIKKELEQNTSNILMPVYPEMKKRIPTACKNQLPYYTFIFDESTQMLRLYIMNRIRRYGPINDDEPLFTSEYTHYNKDERTYHHLTSRQLQKIIKKSAQNAGLSRWNDIKPHTLRKAYKTILRMPNIDGIRIDPETKDFFFGHSLPGSRDPYFDKTKTEELRMEYSKLKFGRVNIENKFKRLRIAVSEAFEGSGEDIEDIINEYVKMKNHGDDYSKSYSNLSSISIIM